jgi:hypothetical protein
MVYSRTKSGSWAGVVAANLNSLSWFSCSIVSPKRTAQGVVVGTQLVVIGITAVFAGN